MTLTAVEQTQMRNLQEQLTRLSNKPRLNPSEQALAENITSRLEDLRRRDADTTRATPVSTGDSGAGNNGGIPPTDFPATPPLAPPQGIPVTPSEPLNEMAPCPPWTKWLPLTGFPAHDTAIIMVDNALTTVNDAAFHVDPEDANGYSDAHLGGVNGPSRITDLSEASERFDTLISDTGTLTHDLREALSGREDDTFSKLVEDVYAPTLTALDDGAAQEGPLHKANTALADSGRGIREAWDAFRESIVTSRDGIARLWSKDPVTGDWVLDTLSMPALAGEEQFNKIRHAIETTAGRTPELATALDDWSVPLPGDDPLNLGSEKKPDAPAPVPSPPSSPSFSGASDFGGSDYAEGDAPEPEGDREESVLQPVSQPIPQMPQMPMPQMPQMPSMAPPDMSSLSGLAESVGDKAQDWGTALSSDTAPAAKPDTGVPVGAEGGFRPAAATQPDTPVVAAGGASQNNAPKPGDQVRPGAVGGDGNLLDKDGDGRMDTDAVSPTKENADPDGDGVNNVIGTPVNINGEPHVINTHDPRLNEIMSRLAVADPDNIKPILEAAKESGVDISDYGHVVPTLEISPGDVVVGTDRGMYLGAGNVLTEGGEIKTLPEVMDYANSQPKAFRLELPELPSDPSSAVPFETVTAPAPEAAPLPVPEAETAPAPEAAPAPAPEGAPAPEPAPEAPVLSRAEEYAAMDSRLTGEQAVPLTTAYTGQALGGETSAEESLPQDTPYTGSPAGSDEEEALPETTSYAGYAMGGGETKNS